MNEVIQVIKKRRSVRRFEPDAISGEIIRDILDCARLAPSGNNMQPWLFGAVIDPDLKRQIAGSTDSGKFIKRCAVCFAVFTDGSAKHFLEDGCAATENILLACTAYGIGSCWVAGYKKDKAESIARLLNVPDQYRLIALVPAGFSKEKPAPMKKSLDEVSFLNRASGTKTNETGTTKKEKWLTKLKKWASPLKRLLRKYLLVS